MSVLTDPSSGDQANPDAKWHTSAPKYESEYKTHLLISCTT